MNATRRELHAENLIAADRVQARRAGREAALNEMARKAPYGYLTLKRANRERTLVGLLAALPMSDVRLCAAAVALETGRELDYILEAWSRLLAESRWGA